MPVTPALHTARLRLRPFTVDDWRALQTYVTNAEVMRYDRPWPTSDKELQQVAAYLATHEGYWAVCLRDAGTFIGHVACTPAEPLNARTWDLGVVLHPDFHHQGYASEAGARLLRYAFEERGAQRVTATCHPANAAVRRMLDRLGMRLEAERTDACAYALGVDEWRALPSAAP